MVAWIGEEEADSRPEEKNDDDIKPGDCVKIVNGLFAGYYAIVLDSSYGDEWEINYFEKRYGDWVIKEGDIDSRPSKDLKKIESQIYGRSRCRYKYTFME